MAFRYELAESFFRKGETSTFCLSLSGFNTNGRSQNALKVPSRNSQGIMPVLPPRADAHEEKYCTVSFNPHLFISQNVCDCRTAGRTFIARSVASVRNQVGWLVCWRACKCCTAVAKRVAALFADCCCPVFSAFFSDRHGAGGKYQYPSRCVENHDLTQGDDWGDRPPPL